MPDQNTQGRYIYAITRSDVDVNDLPEGLNGEPVEQLTSGDLSAFISPISANRPVRPQRKNLAAHQGVLRAINAQATPLPMSFGIVSSSEDQVLELIETNVETLLEQIEAVDGHAEYAVRISFATDKPFDFYVERHPELKQARQSVEDGSRDELIAIGRLFEAILNDERAEHAEKLLPFIEDAATRIDEQPPRTEAELLNLALLVPKEGEEALDAAVDALASQLDDDYAIELQGPWPPHSFVMLNLPAANSEHAAA